MNLFLIEESTTKPERAEEAELNQELQTLDRQESHP
jgi:hypothetical protein